MTELTKRVMNGTVTEEPNKPPPPSKVTAIPDFVRRKRERELLERTHAEVQEENRIQKERWDAMKHKLQQTGRKVFNFFFEEE